MITIGENLIAGGGEEGMCGWLKEKFGVSWQVVPKRLKEPTMANHNPVGWFEIYVQDMERARKFYESVLFNIKLEKLETPDMGGQEIELWAFPMDMQTYGAGGALVKRDGFESGQNSVLIYFSCADCTVEEKRAAELGGRIERNKFSIGQYGFISLVVDTEGNMIGLHNPPDESATNGDGAFD